MTENRAAPGLIGLAQVMAHCGGSPLQAIGYINGAIESAPEDPEPYAVLAELWHDRRADVAELLQGADSLGAVLTQSYIHFLENEMDDAAMAIGGVTGARPTVAWARAPWFSDPRFLDSVSADALAEAVMRTMDYGHDLDTEDTRERLRPWLTAIDVVCARAPQPEAMARMAIFLRACGLTDPSLALCDRADAIEPIMLTEAVRAGTWRKLCDPEQAAAAFRRALVLDPANWSLYQDLGDLHAEQGDFASAVRFVEQGLEHEPSEMKLRAARAAYRTRLTGSADDLRELIGLWPQLPDDAYRDEIVDVACAGPAVPAGLVAEARRLQGR